MDRARCKSATPLDRKGYSPGTIMRTKLAGLRTRSVAK
jgi:hypothetical protein